MNENKNIPQPMDDDALAQATGGTFFGLENPVVTMEHPIVMKDQLEETICSRCGKIHSVPIGTEKCSICGGKLLKHIKSDSSFTVQL